MSKIQNTKTYVPPKRVYTDAELKDFHQKIQRFWVDVTLSDGRPSRRFCWDELAVAYGGLNRWDGRDRFPDNADALRKIKDRHTFSYMVNPGEDGVGKRYLEFNNLWGQYVSFVQKEDWKRDVIFAAQAKSLEQETSETTVLF